MGARVYVDQINIMNPVAQEEWMDDANCLDVDPEIFFREGKGGGPGIYADAKKLCNGCDVRFKCLTYTMAAEGDGHRFGVAGGLTPTERNKLRKRMNDMMSKESAA